MKKIIFFSTCIIVAQFSFGQRNEYFTLVKKADSLYKAKEYEKSAFAYSDAFKAMSGKGLTNDRYNAACSWALSNNPDSSFFQLDRIATKANYMDYQHVTTDPDLVSLHTDERWKPLLEIIKQNKEKAEANLNKPLVAELDSVFTDDQKYRQQASGIEKKYGMQSNEMASLWKTIKEKDSVNLVKVKSLLDNYGWLGADVIGRQGNLTLFLVIQHADSSTQRKYLPMMREAVIQRKANASDLALLEDRVALGKGEKQIYGSQIGFNPETKLYYVLPLEDPDNVDKRRSEVGLGPLSDYVQQWNIKWNVEEYKKTLKEIEAKQKSKPQ